MCWEMEGTEDEAALGREHQYGGREGKGTWREEDKEGNREGMGWSEGKEGGEGLEEEETYGNTRMGKK